MGQMTIPPDYPESPANRYSLRLANCAQLRAICLCLLFCLATIPEALAQTAAKEVFGKVAMPADLSPESVGFYSKGCLAGAVAMPADGPTWQVMRLSRNRRWGHPTLIGDLEKLSILAKKDGWNGLLVGDISQPRGGPMLTGHASHQIGLDADIWLTPMPDKRMSYAERENTSAISVLKKGSFYVDDARWTRAYERLLYHAANMPDVERLLVHPGIKKKLCETVKGDRSWLQKVRPYYGHHYHFHIRIGCQPGSPGCRKQAATTPGTGCDSSLNWWFDVALKPAKPKPGTKPAKPKIVTVKDLPSTCQSVLSASAKTEQQAEFNAASLLNFSAPELNMPKKFDPLAVLASKPIEASSAKNVPQPTPGTSNQTIFEPITGNIPVPTPRPVR
jgi:penicillin-insensitive murein endopeptidase